VGKRLEGSKMVDTIKINRWLECPHCKKNFEIIRTVDDGEALDEKNSKIMKVEVN
jgi:hypothetical protein